MRWQRFDTPSLVGWVKGDGPTLALVLHGGPGLSDYTADLADEVLAGGDSRLSVARYQQRGVPPSTIDGPFTVEQFVADACEILDHLGADRAILVGHSWGGHLAMHIAAARPERSAALLLVDALGAIGDGGSGTMADVIQGRLDEAALAALADLPERTDLDDDRRAEAELRLLWPGYFKDPASAPTMPPITAHLLGASVMGDAMRLLDEGALETALPTLEIPSLHLHGLHSPIDPTSSTNTAALLRHALVEHVDVGHFAWLEHPGSVEAATRRLLEHIDL